jgi:IS4 transposase
MTKEEIVKNLVEQVVAMGFKIRMITLDAGFYTVDVLNFISQFNYIVAVPVGDVKVFEDFDGDYMTNSKRHRRDEQVKFRLLVYSKEKVRRKRKKSLVCFARATNLDLPKGEVLDLYNKVRGSIETSYRNIKAFLPFTSSTKFVFRTLIFVLALVLYLYTVFKGEVGREEFRLLLILLFFPDLFNPENFTINVIETLIYTIDLFLRR